MKQKEKAKRIKNRNSENTNERKRKTNKTTRWISIPNSKNADAVSCSLEKSNFKVATITGTKIQEIVKHKEAKNDINDRKSVVYEIPCKGCDESYVGETGRGVDVRLKEHRNDVKFHRTSNAIVLHIEKCGHLPDWDGTRLLAENIRKPTRKMLEAAHIITRNTFNSRSGFITWSSMAAKLVVGE